MKNGAALVQLTKYCAQKTANGVSEDGMKTGVARDKQCGPADHHHHVTLLPRISVHGLPTRHSGLYRDHCHHKVTQNHAAHVLHEATLPLAAHVLRRAQGSFDHRPVHLLMRRVAPVQQHARVLAQGSNSKLASNL